LVPKVDRRLAKIISEPINHRKHPHHNAKINLLVIDTLRLTTFHPVYNLRREGLLFKAQGFRACQLLFPWWCQLLLAATSRQSNMQIYRAHREGLANGKKE